MKELKELGKYVIAPNVSFYGGLEYDGEDIKLCDDHDIDEGYDFHVKQIIKDDILITDIERIVTLRNGKTVKENSHMELELEKGQLLVYVEGTGFTLPQTKLVKVDEAIGHLKLLEG